jgi:hypothetical protein
MDEEETEYRKDQTQILGSLSSFLPQFQRPCTKCLNGDVRTDCEMCSGTGVRLRGS